MNQQEIDARLAEIGGGDLVHTKIASKKTVKVTKPDAFGDPTQSDAEVTVQRWTNEKTGHVLEAYRKDDGTWEIVKDDPKGVAPSRSAQDSGPPGGKPYIDEEGPTGRRMGWNPTTKAYDRDLGPSPSAQKPAEAPKEEANPNDPTRMRRWNPRLNGGQGGFEDAGPNAAEIERRRKEEEVRTERNKPARAQPIKLEDGTYVQPIYDDKTGRVIRYEPVEGVQPDSKHKPLPPGVPRYTPDPDDPNDDYGLTNYDAALKKAQEAGLITYEQGRDLMADAGQVALVADKRSTTRQTQLSNQRTQDLTQRQQNLSETASRRTAAESAYKEAGDLYSGMLKGLPIGSDGVATRAFRAAMNSQRANAEQWGGMQEYGQIPPAFQAARKVRIGNDGSVNIEIPDPTPNTPLTPADQAAQQQAAQTPNAVGAGAAGSQPAPGGQAAPAAAPAPSGTAAPPARDDWRTNPGDPNVPFNPPPGEPGSDPTRPVGQISPAFEAARTTPLTFHPDRAAVKAQHPDLTDEEIDQAIRELDAEGWMA